MDIQHRQQDREEKKCSELFERGYLYAFQSRSNSDPTHQVWKIGVTKNLAQRLRSYRTAHLSPRFSFTCPPCQDPSQPFNEANNKPSTSIRFAKLKEQAVHKMLKSFRVSREFFNIPEPSIIADTFFRVEIMDANELLDFLTNEAEEVVQVARDQQAMVEEEVKEGNEEKEEKINEEILAEIEEQVKAKLSNMYSLLNPIIKLLYTIRSQRNSNISSATSEIRVKYKLDSNKEFPNCNKCNQLFTTYLEPLKTALDASIEVRTSLDNRGGRIVDFSTNCSEIFRENFSRYLELMFSFFGQQVMNTVITHTHL